LQLQADQLQVPVERPVVAETTALGAAFLAGLAVGEWSGTHELAAAWQLDERFTPAAANDSDYPRWRRAVEQTQGWTPSSPPSTPPPPPRRPAPPRSSPPSSLWPPPPPPSSLPPWSSSAPAPGSPYPSLELSSAISVAEAFSPAFAPLTSSPLESTYSAVGAS